MTKLILIFAALSLSLTAAALEKCDYAKEPSALEKVVKSKDSVILTKRTYDLQNAPFIKGVRVTQILNMAEQTMGSKSADVTAAIKSFDDSKIYRYDFTSTVQLPADFYTVIFAYAGDTEVGSIYEGGTDTMVAEMTDGDIKICKANYGN